MAILAEQNTSRLGTYWGRGSSSLSELEVPRLEQRQPRPTLIAQHIDEEGRKTKKERTINLGALVTTAIVLAGAPALSAKAVSADQQQEPTSVRDARISSGPLQGLMYTVNDVPWTGAHDCYAQVMVPILATMAGALGAIGLADKLRLPATNKIFYAATYGGGVVGLALGLWIVNYNRKTICFNSTIDAVYRLDPPHEEQHIKSSSGTALGQLVSIPEIPGRLHVNHLVSPLSAGEAVRVEVRVFGDTIQSWSADPIRR